MPCRADGYGTGVSPDGRYDDGSGSYDNYLNSNNMPCSDGLAGREVVYVTQEDKSKTNKLTQLLCEATQHLEKAGLIENTSGELYRWFKKHKEEDRKRLKLKKEKQEKENLKRKALSKLSSEEIKALGLTN